ncbi:MAG: hypothetical protein QM813_13370 [Verrucomicrobiota bacterium]
MGLLPVAGSGRDVTVREALDWVSKSLAKTEEASADTTKLKKILKIDPVELCRRRCC